MLQGWRRYGTYCYFIGHVPATFSEANTTCEGEEGYLATVESRYDNNFFFAFKYLKIISYEIFLEKLTQYQAAKWLSNRWGPKLNNKIILLFYVVHMESESYVGSSPPAWGKE